MSSSPPEQPSSRRDRRSPADPAAAAPTAATPHNPTPRAGRNLYAAIGAGVLLGALILVCLFVRKELFVVLAAIASAIGVRELIRALAHKQIEVAGIPLLIAAVGIPVVAYLGG